MQIGPFNTQQIAKDLQQGAKALAQGAADAAGAAQQAAEDAAQQASSAAQQAAAAAQQAAQHAAAAAGTVAGHAASAANEAAVAAGEAVAQGAAAASAAAGKAVATAGGFFSAVGAAALGFAKNVGSIALGIGRGIVAGVFAFGRGVAEVATMLGGVAAMIGRRVANVFGDFFVKQAPELGELADRAREANRGEPQPHRRYDTAANARDFWMLSDAMYKDPFVLPEESGWTEVSGAAEELEMSLIDPETGLEARVFKKVGVEDRDVYVLAFEGTTTGDQGIDWDQNIAHGAGAVPEQYRQALDIGLRFKEIYGAKGDLVVTGHSLGGGLATFAGVGAGIETYTFNPSGLGPGSRMFLDSLGLVARNQHLVKNYVQNGEILQDLRTVQNVLMPWTTLYAGSLQMIGEVEYIGDLLLLDPFGAHNEPQMDKI